MMALKLLVLVSYIYTVSALELYSDKMPQELAEVITPFHQQCNKDIGMTDDELRSAEMDESNEKLKCFLQCVMKETSWIGEDGKFNDVLMEFSGGSLKPYFGKAWTDCRDLENGPGECDGAYNFFNCFKTVDPDKFFIP